MPQRVLYLDHYVVHNNPSDSENGRIDKPKQLHQSFIPSSDSREHKVTL